MGWILVTTVENQAVLSLVLIYFVDNTIPEPDVETSPDTEVNPGIANTKGFTNIIIVPRVHNAKNRP